MDTEAPKVMKLPAVSSETSQLPEPCNSTTLMGAGGDRLPAAGHRGHHLPTCLRRCAACQLLDVGGYGEAAKACPALIPLVPTAALPHGH